MHVLLISSMICDLLMMMIYLFTCTIHVIYMISSMIRQHILHLIIHVLLISSMIMHYMYYMYY